MPTKTNFLKLNKIQENEYYNADIENENLDKLDAAINNHGIRTSIIENKLNKKNHMHINLLSNNSIQSVGESFDGSCGFEVEGMLAENLQSNTDYLNGSDGWEGNSGTIFTTSNNEATFLSNVKDGYIGITTKTRVDDDIIVLHLAMVKSTSSSVYLQHYDGLTTYDDYHSGSDQYELLAIKARMSKGSTICRLAIKDGRLKNWDDVKIKEARTVILKDRDSDLSIEVLKKKYNKWFDGLQPLRGIAIESVGINLFDGKWFQGYTFTNSPSNNAISIKNPLSGEVGKRYRLSYKNIKLGSGVRYNTYDLNMIPVRTNQSGSILTIKDGEAYFDFHIYNSSGFSENDISQVMITEGSQLSPYTSYVSTKQVFETPLISLPNGAVDKIIRQNGKTYIYANTNVGRDGKFYTIKKDDILSVNHRTNVTYARMDLGAIANDIRVIADNNLIGSIQVEGVPEISLVGWDNKKNIGKCNRYTDENSYLDFYFPLNTSLEHAKNKLEGLKIAYQLEHTQIIDLSNELEPLNSFDDYTQFNVNDGVIEYEKVNGNNDGNILSINDDRFECSKLKYKTKSIDKVLFDGKNIIELGVLTPTNANGFERWYAEISVLKSNDIDMNRLYVTYKTVETNSQANAKITYNASLSNAVSSNANTINMVAEQVDRNTDEVHRYRRSIEWIEPTLQNEWVEYEEPHGGPKYSKSHDGIVRLMGMAKFGRNDAVIFKLPEKYCPKNRLFIPLVTYGDKMARCKISKNGDVEVSNANLEWVSFSGVSFYAGN